VWKFEENVFLMLSNGSLPQLFPGFNMWRFLPFQEFLVKFPVLKSHAFFSSPLHSRAVKLPALIAQIQQACITLMNRLKTALHIMKFIIWHDKKKPELPWLVLFWKETQNRNDETRN